MMMVRRALMVIRAQLVTNASEEYACHALVVFMASARCVIQRSTRMHDYNGLVLRLTAGCFLASNCLDRAAFNESRPLLSYSRYIMHILKITVMMNSL